MDVRKELFQMAEPDFQRFAAGLLPNVESSRVLGVRLPKLRRLAAGIARGEWRDFLRQASDEFFEEVMLQGFLIGCAPMELEERFTWIAWFVPKIDNWSVCDSFCSSLKAARERQEEFYGFLEPYLHSKKEYEARFGCVMLLWYFAEETYLRRVLESLEQVAQPDYYARMAVAWAVSICYIRCPEEVYEYLGDSRLDDFTYNKALQKIVESQAVSREDKQRIRDMRRRT